MVENMNLIIIDRLIGEFKNVLYHSYIINKHNIIKEKKASRILFHKNNDT